MNTIQKILSLWLGVSIITSIPYACKDDDKDSGISIKQATEEIQKIQKQIDELAKVLEPEEAGKRLEQSAKSLAEAAATSADAGQHLQEAAQQLAEAAEVLQKEGEEDSKTVEKIKEAAEQMKQAGAAPGQTEEQTRQAFTQILEKLQQAKDFMITPENLVTIPDKAFYEELQNQLPPGVVHDGKLNLNSKAIKKTKKLLLWSGKIQSLEGIEYFTGLEGLSSKGNPLTELDLSQNTALTWLVCTNNQLTSLDLSKNMALTTLNCTNSQLKSLDLSQNTALETLYCSNNKSLSKINLRACKNLIILQVNDANLTELDLSQNTALDNLSCKGNHLTELDLSNIPSFTKDAKAGLTVDEGVKVKYYSPIIVKTIKELYAPANRANIDSTDEDYAVIKISLQNFFGAIDHFTKFDFASGKKVPAESNEWDIAFAGQFIIVNGGEKIKGCTDDAKSELEEGLEQSCTVDNVQPERTGNAAAAIYTDEDYEAVNFDEIKQVKDADWKQDTETGAAIEETDDAMDYFNPNGLYQLNFISYDDPQYLVFMPLDYRMALFRTRDGHYVKMQILNFYKGYEHPEDVPAQSLEYGYISFKYAYNREKGSTDLDTSSP